MKRIPKVVNDTIVFVVIAESRRQKEDSSDDDGEDNSDAEGASYGTLKEDFQIKKRQRRGDGLPTNLEEEADLDDTELTSSPPHGLPASPGTTLQNNSELQGSSPLSLSPGGQFNRESSPAHHNNNNVSSNKRPVFSQAPLVGILGKNLRGNQRQRKANKGLPPEEVQALEALMDQTSNDGNSNDDDTLDKDNGGLMDMRLNKDFLRDKYGKGVPESSSWRSLKNRSNKLGKSHRDQYASSRNSSSISPAIETLVLVFPGKQRGEIEVALNKTGGDVLKAIQFLVAAGGDVLEDRGFPGLQQHVHNNNHMQGGNHPLHHQAFGRSLSHHHQQQSSFSPTQAIDLAMEYPPKLDPKHPGLNNNLKNVAAHHHNQHAHSLHHRLSSSGAPNAQILADLGVGPSGSSPNGNRSSSISPNSLPHENPSAFSLFNTYSAAAAAAAARFNPNHPVHRRYLPSLLPYSLPGMHQPVDFYSNRPLPLMAAALNVGQQMGPGSTTPPANAAAALAATLHLSVSGSNTPGGIPSENAAGNTMDREAGTPPTSCSGSDRASYSE